MKNVFAIVDHHSGYLAYCPTLDEAKTLRDRIYTRANIHYAKFDDETNWSCGVVIGPAVRCTDGIKKGMLL